MHKFFKVFCLWTKHRGITPLLYLVHTFLVENAHNNFYKREDLFKKNIATLIKNSFFDFKLRQIPFSSKNKQLV